MNDSQSVKEKECSVCREVEFKYKCPKCSETYCSVACFKQHKISCKGKAEKDQQEPESEANTHLNLDEDEDIIVTRDKLERLKQNSSIMNKLKNKSLAKIINGIDSTKYKKKTLEKMMQDKDFKDFTDEILTSLGYLDKNKIFTY